MEIKSNDEKNDKTEKITSKEFIDYSELNSENVHNLFQNCMLKSSEVKDKKPTVDFTYVEGIRHNFILSTEKLNSNKTKIAKLIDMLPISALPQTFLGLCYDKNERLWTGDHQTMELLMVLGVACGVIEYTFPQENWQELPGSVPMVNKTQKDLSEVIVGEKPEEFIKYRTKEENKKREEEKQIIEQLQVAAKERFEEHYKTAAPVLEMLGYSMGMEGELYYLYDNKGEKICELSVTPFLGGFAYKGVINDTEVEYCYSCDGKNSDGELVYRDIISVSNIKKSDEAYSGKLVKFELGVGLHEVSNVPRIEVTIIEPDSEEKITKYYATPYDMSFEIENNFGPFGNYEDGTVRSVNYTNTAKTPYVNQGSLLLHESQVCGSSYNIAISRTNTYPETPETYSHKVDIYEAGNNSNPITQKHDFTGKDNANELARRYLKTSRVKILYNHILDHIESEVNGMKDYIHKNYPFIVEIENIMAETPESEQEELVNSVAIKGANIPSENGKSSQKELKQNQ